jgi:hypothetical protein
MAEFSVGGQRPDWRLKADDSEDGLRLFWEKTGNGRQFPGMGSPRASRLSWEEWDRLVAWVAYRRAEQAVAKAAK